MRRELRPRDIGPGSCLPGLFIFNGYTSRDGAELGDHSSFTPAARMMFRQRSVSSFMIAVIPAGVLAIGSADNASKRFATSGSLSIFAIVAERLSALAAGVFGGGEAPQ